MKKPKKEPKKIPNYIQENQGMISKAFLKELIRTHLGSISATAITLLTVLIGFLYSYSHEIIIYPISIPKNLEVRNFTTKWVTEGLKDLSIRKINELIKQVEEESNSDSLIIEALTRYKSIGTYNEDPQLAEFAVSFINYFRESIRLVSGDITESGDMYSLTLKVYDDTDNTYVHSDPIEKNLDEMQSLLEDGSLELLKISAPAILAIDEYYKFKKNPINPKKMEAAFNHCLQEAPKTDDGFVYYLWGLYWLDKNLDEAKIKFNIAIKVSPQYEGGYYGLGMVYNKQDKYREATAQFDKAVKKKPNHPDFYVQWGVALNGLNEHTDAIQKFAYALTLNEQYCLAYTHWGESLASIRDINGAIKKQNEQSECESRILKQKTHFLIKP